MKFNAEKKMNREMKNGRKDNHHMPGIQHPSADHKKQSIGKHLHPQVQHAEQNARSGSRITKNLVKGDAV